MSWISSGPDCAAGLASTGMPKPWAVRLREALSLRPMSCQRVTPC